ERRAMPAAQVQDLADDDVEEGEIALHRQQGLRLREAHGGAEAAVQLDHRGVAERRDAGVAVGAERRDLGDVVQHVDVGGRDLALLARTQPVVGAAEDLDDERRLAGIGHLLRERGERVAAGHREPGYRMSGAPPSGRGPIGAGASRARGTPDAPGAARTTPRGGGVVADRSGAGTTGSRTPRGGGTPWR